MQLKLTVFAVQQFCINDETCNAEWTTLATYYVASAAKRLMRELYAQNAAYELRILPVKQAVSLA